MATTGWTTADIPDQTGRVFVVTGANAGLGLETTKALAEKGAYVVMACRNLDKANAARQGLGAELQPRTEVRELDLADLGSVQRFAEGVADWRIETLVNNAGVMMPPRGVTAQGHELQWGTNVLGPFLLTNLLLPRLTDRVVWLSSQMHRVGDMDLDDLDYSRHQYIGPRAYGRSKLANLMLAYELQRRLATAGSSLRSIAAHPGYSSTSLLVRPEQGRLARFMTWANGVPNVAQPAAMGALPELYAATAPEALGGSYIGPDGPFEAGGHPRVVGSTRLSRDRDLARRLWETCERQTGRPFTV